jgi:diguanylate cyclase (GGDEF)-like protein
MLMMDIDNFKTINDRYGHKMGDVVLKELADVCRKVLREVDIIGRIGGEEFAFVFPNTGLTLGIEVAERLRTMVEKTVVGRIRIFV